MSVDTIASSPAQVERYEWKLGARIGVAPDIAAQEFRKIHQAHKAVTPALVVDAARPAKAPLHDEFEWHNATAADAYREQQARYLMRSFVVVYRKADGTLTPPLRGLIKVVPGPEAADIHDVEDVALEPNHYIPMVQAMHADELRRRHVLQALRDLIAWRQRYKDIAEFARLFTWVDKLKEKYGA